MSLEQEIGRAIRQHRERAGLSQLALGEATGRSVQTIGSIERGERAPSIETLKLLAGVMGVAVRDFFPGDAAAPDEVTASMVGLLAPLTPAERSRAYRLLVAMLTALNETKREGAANSSRSGVE